MPLLSAAKDLGFIPAAEGPQVPEKLTLELGSKQRARNRSKWFCTGLVGVAGQRWVSALKSSQPFPFLSSLLFLRDKRSCGG